MTRDDVVDGVSRVVSKIMMDSLVGLDDEHAAVSILQKVTTATIAGVLVQLHNKGDRLKSREQVSEHCVTLLSAMTPDIMDDVERHVSDYLGLD